MEERALSFKNSVTGAYLVSERMAVLSLLKYKKGGCEHAILILETANAKSLTLYKIVLSPKEKSNKAIIEFESIPLKFLQDLPEKTLCQSWNISTKKEVLLRDLINDQQKLMIDYQIMDNKISYRSRSWENPEKTRSPLDCMTEWLEQIGLNIGRWEAFKVDTTSQKYIVVMQKQQDQSADHSSRFFNPASSSRNTKESLSNLGNEYLKNKIYHLALQEFDQALNLDADYAFAKQGKCQALFELGVAAYNKAEHVNAQQYFQNALTIDPTNPNIKDGLALVQTKIASQPAVRLAKPKKFSHTIENLVFQGGGIKGLAYVGDLEELLNGNYEFSLKNIKRVGGTSAGAITALGLGLGYSLDEIKNIMVETDFTSFFDNNYRNALLGLNERSEVIADKLKVATAGNGVSAVSNLATMYGSDPDIADIKQGFALLQEEDFGLFAANSFRDWVEKIIRLKTGGIKKTDGNIEGGIPFATFRELHQLQQDEPERYQHFKAMYFVGVNLTLNQVEVFSYEHTPDVVVSDALRISMSIPLIFKTHQVFIKNAATGFKPRPDPRGYQYVDGGLLSNMPLWLFDDARYLSNTSATGHQINPHTLGFMLVSPENKQPQEINTKLAKPASKNLLEHIKQLVECIFTNRERQIPTIDDRHRIIFVDNKGVKTTEFNLSVYKRDLLLMSGQKSVQDYFVRIGREMMPEKTHIHHDYFAYLDFSQIDANGNNLLHMAVGKGDWILVQHLCEYAIDKFEKTAKNFDGKTVLDLALELNHPKQTQILALLELNEFPATQPVLANKI